MMRQPSDDDWIERMSTYCCGDWSSEARRTWAGAWHRALRGMRGTGLFEGYDLFGGERLILSPDGPQRPGAFGSSFG
jgi:hypothetical protein